jgi:hypothetical protein
VAAAAKAKAVALAAPAEIWQKPETTNLAEVFAPSAKTSVPQTTTFKDEDTKPLFSRLLPVIILAFLLFVAPAQSRGIFTAVNPHFRIKSVPNARHTAPL